MTQFRHRRVVPADDDALSLRGAVEIFRKPGFGFEYVDLYHDYILNQMSYPVNRLYRRAGRLGAAGGRVGRVGIGYLEAAACRIVRIALMSLLARFFASASGVCPRLF